MESIPLAKEANFFTTSLEGNLIWMYLDGYIPLIQKISLGLKHTIPYLPSLFQNSPYFKTITISVLSVWFISYELNDMT